MKPAANKKVAAKEASHKEQSSEIAELKSLIEFLKKHEVAEFDLNRGDLKVRLKFTQPEASPLSGQSIADLARLMSSSAPASVSAAPHTHTAAPVHAAAAAPAAPAAEPDAELHILKSPIVGTFYESPSPGASAFVNTGDKVQKGQVICIVEAMKLMNEIEADATGEIVKRLVTNGQPVEFGQPLFAIRTA